MRCTKETSNPSVTRGHRTSLLLVSFRVCVGHTYILRQRIVYLGVSLEELAKLDSITHSDVYIIA